MSPEICDETLSELRRLADDDGMGKVMKEHNLDVVVSASGSTPVVFAACAGWPIGTVPLGNLEKNGQSYGLFVLARTEEVLLRFMVGWHGITEGKERVRAPSVAVG